VFSKAQCPEEQSRLLVPIGIALVAILLFIPTTLCRASCGQINEQSVKAGQEIDRLIREVNERPGGGPEPYIKAYEQDARDMNDLIVRTRSGNCSIKVFGTRIRLPNCFDPFRQKFLAGVET
jgi:hypothetical protein